MSLSATWVRLVGAIIVLVGLLLFLNAFGIGTGVHAPVVWYLEAGTGAVVIVFGAWLIWGRPVTA